MNWLKNIRPRIEGMIHSISRFPLTVAFLFAITAMMSIMIEQESSDLQEWIVAAVIGVLVSGIVQMIVEQFSTSNVVKIGLYLLSVAVAFVTYFIVRNYNLDYFPLIVRLGIITVALFIAFLWIPSIKGPHYFHETFLAGLKAFFLAGLYSIVIGLGANLLLVAIDQLLVNLSYKVNLHVLVINFCLIAPLFFLSFIPVYGVARKNRDEAQVLEMEDARNESLTAPKSLVILLTYIVIPLIAIYTVILVMYFALNIRQRFWMDTMLEPLLMSYALTGLFVYLLVCNIDNQMARVFRKVFPKVMAIVMAFQLFSSFMKMQEVGLTHARYFVLLTVVATMIAGIIFSIYSVEKSGWLAVIILGASVIAVTPPVDGFTIARGYHQRQIEQVLQSNNMLQEGEVVPNADVSKNDRERMTRNVSYLESIGGLDDVSGIDDTHLYGENFNELFGFPRENYVRDNTPMESEYVSTEIGEGLAFDVSDVDYLVEWYDYSSDRSTNQRRVDFEVDDAEYTMHTRKEDEETFLEILNVADEVIYSTNLMEQYNAVLTQGAKTSNSVSVSDATFEESDDKATVRIVYRNISLYEGEYSAEMYIMVTIN